MAAAARAAGVSDRHRRHQGRPARQGRRLLHQHRRASASMTGPPGYGAAARPGDVVIVSGPIGEHGVTVMLARGELDIEADLDLGHRAAERPGRARCWTPAATDGCAACATPPAAGSRRSSTRWRRPRTSPSCWRRTRSRYAPPYVGHVSCSGSTRCTSPARAGWSRWWPSSPPRSRWPLCAPIRSARARPSSDGSGRPAGAGPAQDRLRRHPHRRPAGRRPAAAHLLRIRQPDEVLDMSDEQRPEDAEPGVRTVSPPLRTPPASSLGSPAANAGRRSSCGRRAGRAVRCASGRRGRAPGTRRRGRWRRGRPRSGCD